MSPPSPKPRDWPRDVCSGRADACALIIYSTAIVVFDYFLNLDREVLYIWRRSLASATVLYLLLRYASLASLVVTMLSLFPYSGKSSAVRIASIPGVLLLTAYCSRGASMRYLSLKTHYSIDRFSLGVMSPHGLTPHWPPWSLPVQRVRHSC